MMKLFVFMFILFIFIGSASNALTMIRDILNEPAPGNEYLFTASISLGTNHICTGIIVNNLWILTSAICLAEYRDNLQTLDIYYGSHNRTNIQRTQNHSDKIVIHSEFEKGTLTNNLALIRMEKKIIFIPTVVQPVHLFTKDIGENSTVFAVGWEKTNQSVCNALKLNLFPSVMIQFIFFFFQIDQDRPEMLKHYKIKVDAIDNCNMSMRLEAKIICTSANVENTFNTLDNGSALVSDVDKKLIGIASWCDGDIPKVYTKVGSFIPWIRSIAFSQFR